MPNFRQPNMIKRKTDDVDDQSRKKPALEVNHSSSSPNAGEEYWMVQWRNHQTRKHKTWDGDAILVADPSKATLYDADGKKIAVGKAEWPLLEGRAFSVSNKDLELDRRLTRDEYLSGKAFGSSPDESSMADKGGLSSRFIPPKARFSRTSVPHSNEFDSNNHDTSLQSVDAAKNVVPIQEGVEFSWTVRWRKPQHKKHQMWDGDASISYKKGKIVMTSEEGKFMGSIPWKGEQLISGRRMLIGNKEVELDSKIDNTKDITQECINDGRLSIIINSVAPTSFYGKLGKGQTKPRHDPNAENAIVMKVPTTEHIKKFNKKNLPVVPVVLDPVISRFLRPHQIEGVKFMYECVMGLRRHEGQGCILADEMGLGKTLQTIVLVWTLVKQNPYAAPTPAVEKVLIVCPVSLVNNWKGEFHKWLGRDRVGIVTCDKDNKNIPAFMHTKKQQVLIIGYERLRTVIEELALMVPPIGLIICDEGHRLKSANKTTLMFASLRTRRRIILSGTPIQNNLSEFHAMADFCNPGLLDDYSTFRRVYEVPILKARAPASSSKEVEVGNARISQLLAVAKSFVLRRDTNLLKNILPPKHEYVVFVTPTALQLSIFTKLLQPDRLDDIVQSSTAESLALISMLTKVSNSPILMRATADKAKIDAGDSFRKAGVDEALRSIPEDAHVDDITLSGKLTAISNLLDTIRSTTEEKCVLVSHFTSTLNILEAFCRANNYSYFRLDGKTPANKRQEFVNIFNRSSRKQSFVFLLSSKAGGVGINLIGASRLCLVDSDWNPSHDLQSMARCHRDGQKHPVYIYRFLTAGTIDEKIYQRQVTKLGLTSSVMEPGSANSKSDSFTRKDLRDIFRIHPNTLCNTHDLLECPCELTEAPENVSFSEDCATIEQEQEQGFVKACHLTTETLDLTDLAYLKKKKVDLAALGEWKHINCLRATARDEVYDDVLRNLIDFHEVSSADNANTKSGTRCGGVIGTSTSNNTLTTRDVPGGVITYLFQKSSTLDLSLDV